MKLRSLKTKRYVDGTLYLVRTNQKTAPGSVGYGLMQWDQTSNLFMGLSGEDYDWYRPDQVTKVYRLPA